MDVIKVNKNTLLEILKKNRSEHVRIYNESMVVYKTKQSRKLEEAMFLFAEKGELPSDLKLPVPYSYASYYDLTIEMLEMDVSDEVELVKSEFQQYVKDEWNWKSGFNTIATSYDACLGVGQETV